MVTSDISKSVSPISFELFRILFMCILIHLLLLVSVELNYSFFDWPFIFQYLSRVAVQQHDPSIWCCTSARWITCSISRDRYASNYIACHPLNNPMYTNARERWRVCAENRVEAFIFPMLPSAARSGRRDSPSAPLWKRFSTVHRTNNKCQS